MYVVHYKYLVGKRFVWLKAYFDSKAKLDAFIDGLPKGIVFTVVQEPTLFNF